MLIRLFLVFVLALAALYAAEGFGLIPARKYLPSLPRLEASTSEDWMNALRWTGSAATCLIHGNGWSACTDRGTRTQGGGFTHRVSRGL